MYYDYYYLKYQIYEKNIALEYMVLNNIIVIYKKIVSYYVNMLYINYYSYILYEY